MITGQLLEDHWIHSPCFSHLTPVYMLSLFPMIRYRNRHLIYRAPKGCVPVFGQGHRSLPCCQERPGELKVVKVVPQNSFF